MDKVATMPVDRRSELFRETAAKKRLSVGLVEKDFWVCWSLHRLFARSAELTGNAPFQRWNFAFEGLRRHRPLFGRCRLVAQPRRPGFHRRQRLIGKKNARRDAGVGCIGPLAARIRRKSDADGPTGLWGRLGYRRRRRPRENQRDNSFG